MNIENIQAQELSKNFRQDMETINIELQRQSLLSFQETRERAEAFFHGIREQLQSLSIPPLSIEGIMDMKLERVGE